MMDDMRRGVAFPILVAVVTGCGSAPITTRVVDDPAGEGVEYGAPEQTEFQAELDAGREFATVTVYRKAQCAVIPVTIMQRYKEKVRNGEVLERSPMNKRQVADEPTGQIACDQSYANNIEVLLEADGGRFSLGVTDERGRVRANLAEVFKVASFDEVPAEGTIMLRSRNAQPLVEAGKLDFRQLAKQQARIAELMTKLESILAKGETGASPEEITRSYEIYNQLIDLGPHDPRVKAVGARFWELFYGRKREEARERMGKNLDALKSAQSTLKGMGDAALPIYVQAAVNSGTLDRRALEWSSLRLLRALRGAPAVCAGGFSWTSVPTYGWSREAQLAAQYSQFAYGAGHADALRAACSRF